MNSRLAPAELSRRQFIAAGIGALLAPQGGFAYERSEHPVVATTNGKVRGYADRAVYVFRGIRYGADTSARRFQPPRAPTPWEGTIDAFEYGASSPQSRPADTLSEDCLFLNVWTPGISDGAHRPVMFYIHGGAYSHGSGSSPLYDGSVLAGAHNAVVVTVNHRLNAFGYLYLQRFGGAELADSGNCGQLDLVLALEWVRNNIGAFGGDPARVLAFGQSGGGAKIATMMAMPAAKGLFHSVATMSGQQVTASGPANATLRTRAFLDALGLGTADVSRLQELPFEQLLRGLEAPDPVLPYGSVYFGPVLDMRSLERHPFYPDAAPQSARIPMIIGNTRDETRAFLRDDRYYDLQWDDLPELLIPNMRVDLRPEYVVARYRDLYPDYTPTQVFFAATTAARSWRGAIIEAEQRAEQDGADTFVYQLDFPSPEKPQLGAPHSFDIPLVFGNLSARGSIIGTGKEAQTMSDKMSESFANFARTGIPTSAGLPEWQPFTLPTRETMVFDVHSKMVSDPRGAERRLFARVPYVQPGT